MRLAPRPHDLKESRRPLVDAGVARQPQKTPVRGRYGFAVAVDGRAWPVPLLVWAVRHRADGCRPVEERHARRQQWMPALELIREVVAPARLHVL